ncbi:hypothetical protein HYFRA_00008187 [Hymenoscyphus fraxineus]|uniref:Uncharacterized protein n=1 Tax=Hymenoscyphus fraxineus TaxID=746836 RepID=A0A9N9L9F6_9HELO|nr:hypothetical protein HYFRA_00008187 [Hymenoscyphus fraxineus]
MFINARFALAFLVAAWVFSTLGGCFLPAVYAAVTAIVTQPSYMDKVTVWQTLIGFSFLICWADRNFASAATMTFFLGWFTIPTTVTLAFQQSILSGGEMTGPTPPMPGSFPAEQDSVMVATDSVSSAVDDDDDDEFGPLDDYFSTPEYIAQMLADQERIGREHFAMLEAKEKKERYLRELKDDFRPGTIQDLNLSCTHVYVFLFTLIHCKFANRVHSNLTTFTDGAVAFDLTPKHNRVHSNSAPPLNVSRYHQAAAALLTGSRMHLMLPDESEPRDLAQSA